MATSATADLSKLSWNFADVSSFCAITGTKHENKGYKYFAEKYIHDVRVVHEGDASSGTTAFRISGKCYRSMRKNELPHSVTACITVCGSTSVASRCSCSCTIGNSGCCGHVIGLLYQVAEYKVLNLTSVPDPVPSTSLPQQWHKPRGHKIAPSRVQDVQLSAPSFVQKSRAVSSTLYNPLPSSCVTDFLLMKDRIKEVYPQSQWLTVYSDSTAQQNTMFGNRIKGSVLSYQQQEDPVYITNFPGVEFPDVPVVDVMNPIPYVMTVAQQSKLAQLTVTRDQSVHFEQETRVQADSKLWHELRQSRITASKIGSVCSRRKDFKKLCDQLRRKFRATHAMKEGTLREPHAAVEYAKMMSDKVNLYPCGLVISPQSPWIAASPDRKVYCHERSPPFGLLEIKCPQADNMAAVKCLQCDRGSSTYTLKKSHEYYHQVMCQLAVTGLEWCDFFVYLHNGQHYCETIWFDSEFWAEAQGKVDRFFFTYFIYAE